MQALGRARTDHGWDIQRRGDAGLSSGRQMKDTEVDYFCRTIFEPAMANRQKDGNATRRTNRNDGVMSLLDGGHMVSSSVDDEVSDTVGPPPPTRPSAKIF